MFFSIRLAGVLQRRQVLPPEDWDLHIENI